MRFVGIMFFMFASPLLFAKDARSLVNFLNQLNSTKFRPAPIQCTEDINQKCAIDLCGKPTDTISMMLNDRTFQQYTKPEVMKRFDEVEKEITDLVKQESEKNKKFISNLRLNLVDGKLDFKFNEWTDEDYNDFAEKVFDEHLDIVVNKKLVFEDRIKIKPIYPEDSSETFKMALDSFAKSKTKLILSDKSEGLRAGIFSKDETIVIVNERWNSFYKKYLEKVKIDPDFMKEDLESINAAKLDVESLGGDGYAAANSMSSIHSLLLTYTYRETGSYPSPVVEKKCHSLECYKGIQEFLTKQDVNLKLKNLEVANSLPSMTKGHLAYCKSNLAMRALKESDKNEFSKLIPEIQKNVLTKSLKGFSDHSKKSFEDYLKGQIHFSFIPKGVSVDDFIETIKKAHISISKSSTESEEFSPQKSITELLRYEEMGSGVDPMANTYFCMSQMQATVWDAFAPKVWLNENDAIGEDIDLSNDNILVSKFSCTHHESGKGVLAHEMGHALSWAFSEGRLSDNSLVEFKKLRACANSHHKISSPFTPDPLLVHEGDTYLTEEDTADLVSYMAYPDNDHIFECALIETTDDGENYTNLSLENSEPRDTHSSGLFRALMEAVHKKMPIPQSCTEVMQASPKHGFDPCF